MKHSSQFRLALFFVPMACIAIEGCDTASAGCGSDAECATGRICEESRCVTAQPIGEQVEGDGQDETDSSPACVDDAGCQPGEACIQGSCKTKDVAQFSLSGVVNDWRSGEPLSGVSVALSSGVATSDSTDATGHYMIPAIDEGTYDLVFSRPGHFDYSVEVSVFGADKTFSAELLESESVIDLELTSPEGNKDHLAFKFVSDYRQMNSLTLAVTTDLRDNTCEGGTSMDGLAWLHLKMRNDHRGIEEVWLIVGSGSERCDARFDGIVVSEILYEDENRFLVEASIEHQSITASCGCHRGPAEDAVFQLGGEFFIVSKSAPLDY